MVNIYCIKVMFGRSFSTAFLHKWTAIIYLDLRQAHENFFMLSSVYQPPRVILYSSIEVWTLPNRVWPRLAIRIPHALFSLCSYGDGMVISPKFSDDIVSRIVGSHWLRRYKAWQVRSFFPIENPSKMGPECHGHERATLFAFTNQ